MNKIVNVSLSFLLAVTFGVTSELARATDTYTNAWAQQNGSSVTINFLAATDDTDHGVQHEATVSMSLSGPGGPFLKNGSGSGFHSEMITRSTSVAASFTGTSQHTTACGGFVGGLMLPPVDISLHKTHYKWSYYVEITGPPLNWAESQYFRYCPTGVAVCGGPGALITTGYPAPNIEFTRFLGVKINNGPFNCMPVGAYFIGPTVDPLCN